LRSDIVLVARDSSGPEIERVARVLSALIPGAVSFEGTLLDGVVSALIPGAVSFEGTLLDGVVSALIPGAVSFEGTLVDVVVLALIPGVVGFVGTLPDLAFFEFIPGEVGDSSRILLSLPNACHTISCEPLILINGCAKEKANEYTFHPKSLYAACRLRRPDKFLCIEVQWMHI